MPPTDPDTLFEDLLQDLPPETIAMAYECKAFCRARKITTPQQLLRGVLLYCGLAQSLREVAGTMTVLGARLTDSAIAERWAACRPWVKALRPTMLEPSARVPRRAGRRCIVIDCSTVHAPAATGIHYRLHRGLDRVTLAFTHVYISAAKTGARWRHCALGPHDIALADRGSCHPAAVAETVHAGAQRVGRRQP